jgi:hypothetical protein
MPTMLAVEPRVWLVMRSEPRQPSIGMILHKTCGVTLRVDGVIVEDRHLNKSNKWIVYGSYRSIQCRIYVESLDTSSISRVIVSPLALLYTRIYTSRPLQQSEMSRLLSGVKQTMPFWFALWPSRGLGGAATGATITPINVHGPQAWLL